ncbi:primase/DNA polymerase [Hyperthermophilic Archaeal Virus 2]|uniref:primase/DNA polymerase n=1 Tax=Hyperthermophilic Archaeal Virus 2 TaxID=762906 RepID=UPI0001DBAE14|nr:primase/DNA polymerase [Hyperthermophilic Archaeal Virus 2]ADJ54264.1 primase/DNA polymerase [Hyperthermophilic Archaeal Virus 2]
MEPTLALRLYDLGFNIIPVDKGKKPLTSWSTRQRISRDELEKLLEKASGIGIAGGAVNPWSPVAMLAIIDVDNPDVLEKHAELKRIVESTVSWKTGPRCPRCGNKHLDVLNPGHTFRCDSCGAEFTIEEAKRGIGALVSLDVDTAEKYIRGTVRGRDVEILVNNYALIPPSTHPSGVQYEWIRPFDFKAPNLGIRALVESELASLLEELGVLKPHVEQPAEGGIGEKLPGSQLRELADSDIIAIKELLKEAYRPGVRQYVWLFLSGWAAKAGISPVSIAKVLKMLHDETGDEDPVKSRASSIVYSYRKAGIDLTPYASEFEELFGVKPYGLEKEIREEEVKGKTGIQEILEEVLGEEKALEVIKEIEEKFKVSSPFRDSVIELLDYEKQIYAVANLRKLLVVRARRSEDRLVYKEKVFIGAPTKVVVYYNPVGGVTKYQVTWEVAVRPKPLVIGPALQPEILDRLEAEGLVVASRLARDVLAAIIHAYQVRGRAELKTEIESPGFYMVDGKLQAVSVEVKEPSPEELKEALLLLNELATKWFKHMPDKFATVIKWGLIAPFIYAYKQRGKWIRWLYLYGSSKTGKTTLAEIATVYLWRLDPGKHHKTGASMDTPARLGHVLSQSTFPVAISEPAGALDKSDIVEIIKASVEGLTARGKYHRGAYTDIPALAPLVFTSNKYVPRDDTLLRRFKVLHFTYGERVPEELATEFESKVKPELKKLKAIGDYTASYFLKNGIGEDLEKQGIEALEAAYRSVGLEPPEWLRLDTGTSSEAEIFEDMREQVRVFLVKRVNEEYNRFVGRVTVEKPDEGELFLDRSQIDLKTRIEIVLDKQLIPWLLRKGNDVLITTGIMHELEEVTGDIGGLKSLAELLGWEYMKYSMREGERVKNMAVVKASLEDLLSFLTPHIE